MFSQKTKLVTPIDLHTPLSLNSSFRFPLQSAVARRVAGVGELPGAVPARPRYVCGDGLLLFAGDGVWFCFL